MAVRAAAYVARLLQGIALPFPPGLDAQVAAEAVREGADLSGLRQTARSAPLGGAAPRRGPGAWRCCRTTSPARWRGPTRCPSIRHRVGGALDLSIVSLPGAST